MKSRSALTMLLLVFTLSFSCSTFALGPLDPAPGPWSLAREKGCAAGNTWDCYLWLLDPPSLSEIYVEIEFDPTKMTVLDTGFLCDFAKPGTASCPTTAPGTTGDGTSTILGDPLDGAVVDMVLGTGFLNLRYTLPVDTVFPDVGDRNFFAIQFASPFEGVTFFETPGTYDFMQTRTECRTTEAGRSCGSSHPVYGANFYDIAEPGSVLLAGIGLGLMGVVRPRRRRHPLSRALAARC